jgi:formamidopyrimidine-DNA glycosylase
MIAGLGNVYTDEILFQAGIHPKTKADRIQAEALEALFQIMREDVLPTVIDRRADPSRFPEEYLIPRRKKGANCPKCGSELEQVQVSGRTACLCPKCQKK